LHKNLHEQHINYFDGNRHCRDGYYCAEEQGFAGRAGIVTFLLCQHGYCCSYREADPQDQDAFDQIGDRQEIHDAHSDQRQYQQLDQTRLDDETALYDIEEFIACQCRTDEDHRHRR